jgi:hypothetical protein
MTLAQTYEKCGRAFARNGWPQSQVVEVMRGIQDQRLADFAVKAFCAERDNRPFDAELPEGLA